MTDITSRKTDGPWIKQVLESARENVAAWPKSKRQAAGITKEMIKP